MKIFILERINRIIRIALCVLMLTTSLQCNVVFADEIDSENPNPTTEETLTIEEHNDEESNDFNIDEIENIEEKNTDEEKINIEGIDQEALKKTLFASLEATEVKEWTSNNSLPTEAGSYYLTTDVILSSTWAVPVGINNLDLNGHVINANGGAFSVITVTSEATLNLYDDNPLATHSQNDLPVGGVITGGRAGQSSAGGVYVNKKATFTMEGGTITGCSGGLYSAGGVYVNGDGNKENNGVFTMNGGTITSCTASGNFSAGGVFVAGTFNMNDSATISNCSATDGDRCVGGVMVAGHGTLIMNGGNIINCTGDVGGVCVFNSNTKELTMTAGTISNNKGLRYGGILIGSDVKSGVFVLGGTANITNNKVGETASNVFLPKGQTITLATGEKAPTEGMNISVSLASDYTGNFVSNGNIEDLKDVLELDNPNAQHVVNGIVFDKWESNNSLPTNDGYYYLTADVTLSSTWTLGGGVDIQLDLNGHTVAGNNSFCIVNIDGATDNKATLALYDSDPQGRGTIKNGSVSGQWSGGGVRINWGTFNMYGGTITNCKTTSTTGGAGGVYIGTRGTFNMYGGKITNCSSSLNGGGVYVAANDNAAGVFNMAGGIIDNCSADNIGGGVYLASGTNTSLLNMTSGTISNCTAQNQGGGVYVNGAFEMSGGNITGNASSNSDGGGIFVNKTKTLNISGDAVISGNKAKYQGGGIYNDAATIIISGGEIKENQTIDEDSKWHGGGIYNGGSLTLGGNAVCIDNKSGSVEDNLYLVKDKKIVIGNGSNGAPAIGDNFLVDVTLASDYSGSMFSGSPSADVLNKFASNDPYASIGVDGSYKSSWERLQDAINGVSIPENNTVEVKDGVIKLKADAVAKAGEAKLNIASGKTATIDLNGFDIDRNNQTVKGDNGNAIYVDHGTLTIKDSTAYYDENVIYISGNITGGYSGSGAGIYNAGGTVTLNSGSISNNIATSYAGGIFNNNGTVNINGGEVRGNTTNGTGGGICHSWGTGALNITGGRIIGNHAGTSGGGVSVGKKGNINMTGGEIVYNSCGNTGGGISVDYYSDGIGHLLISGGTISNNTSVGNGGGIYHNGEIIIGGTTVVTGNKKGGTITNDEGIYSLTGGTEQNVYLPAGKTLTLGNGSNGVSAPSEGMSVGIDLDPDYTGKPFTGTCEDLSEKFTSDNSEIIINDDGTIKNPWSLLQDALNGSVLDNENVEIKDGVVTLKKDIIASNNALSLSISSSKTPVLDLNGYVIKMNGKNRVFSIKNATLTIVDSNPEREHEDTSLPSGGVITGGSNTRGGGAWIDGATLNISGGTIYKCTAPDGTSALGGGGIYVCSGGALNMTGGAIIECSTEKNGGAIYIAQYNGNAGKVTLENVTISNNISSNFGGGIYSEGTVTMNSGTISENNALYGGGIFTTNVTSVFTMNNGTITKNTSTTEGGGLFVQTGSSFVMKTGEVSENSSATGGGIHIYSSDSGKIANVEIQNGSVINNTATKASGGITFHKNSILKIADSVILKNNKVGNSERNLVSDSATYKTTTYSGGDGSASYPYLICDTADIVQLAYNVNQNGNTYSGKYFKVTDNISYTKSSNDIKYFSIGQSLKYETATPFKGNFDGDGHTINMNLDYTGSKSSLNTVGGLFGNVQGSEGSYCVIKNVIITGEVRYTNSPWYAGGIVGQANYVTINNCVNNCSSTTLTTNIGGICGMGTSVNILNCGNTSDVTGGTSVGGIIGCLNGGRVENCYNTGNIKFAGRNNSLDAAGGIVGYAQPSYVDVIKNCYSTGSVIKTTGGTTGKPEQGGTGHFGNAIGIAGTMNGSEYVPDTTNITIEDVYYRTDDAPNIGDGEGRPASNFDDGTIITLLNENVTKENGYNYLSKDGGFASPETEQYYIVTLTTNSTEEVNRGTLTVYPTRYLEEDTVNLTCEANDGYLFAYYESEDIDVKDIVSNSFTMPKKDIAIKAVFGKENCVINYKDEGNNTFTGSFSGSYPQTHTYGTATTLVSPTKTGYTFKGWFINSECTGNALTSLGATDYLDDITLYAKWEVQTYNITYKDKGGSDFSGVYGTSTPTTHTYDAVTNLVSPSKTNYTFDGWFIEQDCSGTALTSLSATGYTDDIILYAKWSLNVFTITYLDKGGSAFSGTHEVGYPQTHTYGTATTLKDASKTGYTFNGWFKDEACAESAITSLGATDYTNNITLYAKWTAKEYTITYRDQGDVAFSGTHEEGYPEVHTYDSVTTLKSASKDYHTFEGWYTDKDCTSAITSLGATDYTAGITLYAKWSEKAHNYAYSVSNNVLTATCQNDDCTTEGGHSLSLSLAMTASLVYDGNAKEATFGNGEQAAWEGAGLTTPTIIYSAKEGSSLTNDKAINVGSYTASITVNNKTASIDFNIVAVSVTVGGLAIKDKEYNGKSDDAIIDLDNVTFTGLIDGDELSISGIVGTYASADASESQTVNLNAYTNWTLTGTSAANYVLATSGQPTSLTGKIDKASITSAEATSQAFTGLALTPVLTVKAGDLDATYDVGDWSSELINPGIYTTTVTGNGNFKGSVDVSFEITALQATAPSAATGLIYDGTNQTGVAEGTGYSVTNGSAANAGDYKATAILSTGYTWADGSTEPINIDWSIARKDATVTANNKTKVYGQTDPTLTATVDGTIGSDTLSYTLSRAIGENVGSYTITASGDAIQTNYNVTYVAGTFEITKKPIDVPEAISGLIYDGTEQTGVAESTGYTLTNNKATAAGSYKAIASLDNNYKWSDSSIEDKEIDWSIAKAEVVVPSINETTFTYNGTSQTYMTIAEDASYKLTEDSDLTTRTNAGTNTIKLTLKDTTNYKWANDASDPTYTFTINKAALTITAKAKTISYTDEASNNGVEYSGFVNEETSSVLSGELSYSYGEYTTSSIPGNYKITPSGLSSDNYSITFVDGTLTVTDKVIDKPTEDLTVFTYTGEQLTYNPVNFDSSTMNISGNKKTNANTTGYTVTVTPKTYYKWSEGDCTFTWIINKANPSITTEPTASAITYGDTLANSSLTNGEASVDGTFAWTSTSTKPLVSDSDSTEYDVTFIPDDTNNYNTATCKVKLTINKATPTITTAPTTSAITYGETLANSTLNGGEASVDGTFAWTSTSTKPLVSDSNSTEYEVTFIPSDIDNYNTNTCKVKLTINKATPTITTEPTASAITYGDTLASSNLTNGEASVDGTFVWSIDNTTPSVSDSDSTEYEVTFIPSDIDNYNTNTCKVTLTINKADQAAPTGLVGVKPTKFGGSDGKITGTTTDMEYSESTSFDPKYDCGDSETTGLSTGTYYVRLKADDNHNSGSYATVAVGSGDKEDFNITITNYNGTYDGNEHSITLTGVPTDATVQYGTSSGTYDKESVSFTDFTDGDKVIYVKVTKYGYNDFESTGTVNILRKDVTVTCGDFTKVYGENDPTLTATVSGTLNEDTITYTVVRESGEDVGTYAIGAEGDEAQGNYSVTYKNGEFEITKASINLPTAVTGLIYNGLSQTGVEEGVGYNLTNNTSTNVGNFKAIASLDNNHKWSDSSIENKEIDWSISKAPLTITAKNNTIYYGDVASNKGVEYSGFVNSETEAVLSGSLIYSYGTYTTSSDVGEYWIIPSGLTSTNYEITYVNGKLTVERKVINKPTAVDKTYTYTGEQLTFELNDFDSATMNISGNTQTNANENGYTVTVTPKDNYAWSEGECKFTWVINKAEQTTPSVGDGYVVDYTDETIIPSSGYEISISEDSFDDYKLNDETAIDFNETYYVRKAGDNNHLTSSITSNTFSRPNKPSTPILDSKSDIDITIKVNDNQEYSIDNGTTWVSDGDSQDGDLTSGTITFTGLTAFTDYDIITRVKATSNSFVSENSDVLQVKTLMLYFIEITNDGNGSATSSVTKAEEGDEVTLTYTPKPYFEFDYFEVISGEVTITDNKFVVGTSNIEIKAHFKQKSDYTSKSINNSTSIDDINIDSIDKEGMIAIVNEYADLVNYVTNGSKEVEAYVVASDPTDKTVFINEGVNETNAIFVDIDLFAKATDEDEKQVTNTNNQMVKVTISLTPEQASKIVGSNKNYYVLRYHDGEITRLDATLVIQDDTYLFSFESDRFSTFALYSQNKSTKSYSSYTIPKTGVNK